MVITVVKTYNVNCCSECPYMKTHVDYSVCEDSFDEPNFEWYCGKEGHFGKRGFGKLIDIGLSRFSKCDIIPDWCPEKEA